MLVVDMLVDTSDACPRPLVMHARAPRQLTATRDPASEAGEWLEAGTHVACTKVRTDDAQGNRHGGWCGVF